MSGLGLIFIPNTFITMTNDVLHGRLAWKDFLMLCGATILFCAGMIGLVELINGWG